jgi:hypothetical protein
MPVNKSIPLICPPQSTPPVDGNPTLFNKIWWLFFHHLAKAVAKLVASNSGGGGGLVVLDKTLTANSTTIDTSTATAGNFFQVVVHEDTTGGWTQTWPAAFLGMAGFLQTTTLSTYTAALFYTPDGTTFQLVAAPVTGVS